MDRRPGPASGSPCASARTGSSPSATAASSSWPRRAPASTSPGSATARAYPESKINIKGAPFAGSDRHPGGPRLRRRPHPRHGLRVPRRRRPLRQAVGQVRRAVRARRLPRPRDRHQPARGGAVRRAQPRPGRLADVQGLAGARLADPRGHLLQVDGALLARRPAALRQPARREQPALHALPVRPRRQPAEELLRRHGLRAPAGQADAPVPGLHRRPVGRPGQGLVPHRHLPVGGPPRHQRGQDGHHHGHRDLGAVRLHVHGHARPATSPPARPSRSTSASTRRTTWACGRWSWSTSSTTRCPA